MYFWRIIINICFIQWNHKLCSIFGFIVRILCKKKKTIKINKGKLLNQKKKKSYLKKQNKIRWNQTLGLAVGFIFICNIKNKIISLAWCGSVSWALPCTLRNCWCDSSPDTGWCCRLHPR